MFQKILAESVILVIPPPPPKKPIVCSAHEEAKSFGSKMKREARALETLRQLHCPFINKFSPPQIAF